MTPILCKIAGMAAGLRVEWRSINIKAVRPTPGAREGISRGFNSILRSRQLSKTGRIKRKKERNKYEDEGSSTH